MMMEKRHRCKLCLRSFGNGRALGGHMRSHMMKFYASDKRDEVKHAFDSVDDSYSSSSDDDDEESALLVDHGFGSESDPICRRSNRVRKARVSDLEDGFFHVDKKLKFGGYCSPEAELSSVSDTTSEEHLAHCLIMLSRDTWQREEEEEEYSGAVVVKTKVGRGKYRCEECNKLFRSYQALGGHRASHKKIKLNTPPPPPPRKISGSPPEKKVHECPFCDRVFSSGQALGGHKRTHFIAAAAAAAAASKQGDEQSPVIREKLKIDLNLPAPVDEDEDEYSQIAVSAVSDEEFVRPIMR